MIRLRQLFNSLKYAGRGLSYSWQHEQNFRVQACIGIIVILAGLWLGVSAVRMIIVLLLVLLVLVLELLNTFFEKLIDVVHPRVHHYAATMKDILAATVLLSSVGAIVIGILIFWPYLSR